MKLIHSARHLETLAIEELGIPSLLLMEAAGSTLAVEVAAILSERNIASPKNKSSLILIFCGSGNNGGDGFVCARHLAQQGFKNIMVLQTQPQKNTPQEATTNRRLLEYFPINYMSLTQEEADEQSPLVYAMLQQAEIVVDALLGTGLNRPLEGWLFTLIEAINQARSTCHFPVIAVDIPSGIHSETGQVMGIACQADMTLTFSLPKTGLYLPPGKQYAGLTKNVPVFIPEAVLQQETSCCALTIPHLVRHWLPQKKATGHKYSNGSALIIAGCSSMAGAAWLSSTSAMKIGTGVVTLATPEEVFRQMAFPPEMLRLPLETALSLECLQQNIQSGRYTAIAIGPGMGAEPEKGPIFRELLTWLKKAYEGVVVLDADALTLLAQLRREDPYMTLGKNWVLTPHPGEAARLLVATETELLPHGSKELASPRKQAFYKENTEKITRQLISSAQLLQQRYDATVVLKGSTTVVAMAPDPAVPEPYRHPQFLGHQQPSVWISPTGNPGMATAGCGDVLTGVITGLAAQGLPAERAAIAGVLLHGYTADRLVEFPTNNNGLSSQTLQASDIMEGLKLTWTMFSRNQLPVSQKPLQRHGKSL